jgi:hypothetical protein
LFLAWREFRRGKRNKNDAQEFEFNLEDNLFQLHQELKNKTYQHSHYTSFYVSDPKLRLRHRFAIEFCITRFLGSYIRFLISALFLIHTLADWIKEHTGRYCAWKNFAAS